MKKNIIIAAIAAASALLLCASCQKQELIEQNNGNVSGKTFTATIEQGLTKTTITSEYKVNWVEGDQIDINGSIFSATPDASDATKASLTKVSGSDPTPDYTAVYPASIMVGTQATLPATQTYAAGKFNAPMCAMSSTESLEFKNFCGVLCFALKGTDKVKSIAVTANEQLCGPFKFTTAPAFDFTGGEGKTVTLDCGEGVQLNETTATNFYISLPPKDSYTAGMKIVVTSTEGKTFEKTTTTAVKIERNNLYTFDWTASFSSAEPEYVEIGGVKWATKNLGATTVAGSYTTCYGDLYQWGSVNTLYDGFPWTSATTGSFTWKTGKEAGFVEANREYTGTDATLPDANDVVKQTIGGGWRMPTTEEFKALYDACGGTETPKTGGSTSTTEKGVYWCTSYDGVAGLLFCDGTNKLFFPAAGYGDGTDLYDAGSFGYYWSSSLFSDYTDYAYHLYFYSDSVLPQCSYSRCYGYSVRPVKDAAPAPTPTPAVENLVTGYYSYACSNGDEGLLTLSAVDATNYTVSGLGISNGIEWNAVYDKADGTLTMDGTINGHEQDGNMFCYPLGWFNVSEGTVYTLESYGEGDSGKDPIVFDVDTSTGELTAVHPEIYVSYYLGASGEYVDDYNTIEDGATVEFLGDLQTTSVTLARGTSKQSAKPVLLKSSSSNARAHKHSVKNATMTPKFGYWNGLSKAKPTEKKQCAILAK